MKKLITLVFFIILSCSKDSPIPDAVVPTPEPTATFTLVVTASDGGSVNDPGETHNENANVSLTATPADGYAFSGWTGDASGSTNPLSVSMTSDKNIAASFIRLQYSLSVNRIGSGTVSQVLVESTEKNTDYDSFSTVRLTALPESNWVFYGWSGSTTETTSEIEVVMEGTKAVTATFEERLSQVIGVDDVFFGNGKWKIRKPKGSSGPDQEDGEANKQVLANCELSEIIFRTDGSFTLVTGTTTATGQFIVDSNTTVSLTQAQAPFGTITNLVLTNNFISFSIQLADGCTEDATGSKDETYDETTDTSLPPVISLVGSPTIYLEAGDTFADPGATAVDIVDGDLTSSITTSGTVDISIAGTYTVVYSVIDSSDNSAFVLREVVVNTPPDTTAPVITLIGSIVIELSVGDTFTDPGATATDNVDGDLTSSITSSGTVDTSMAGEYAILYAVTDAAGNTASVYREINVRAAATTYSISVTASSNSDYTLSGTDVNGTVSGDDVSITINKGDTLSFDVNAPNHPFYIKTVQGTGTDNLASNVTNNGTIGGVLNWTPTVAGIYYYQCSVHDGMYGTITVQ